MKIYPGSQRLGSKLVDTLTKEDFATIAFFLAQRLSSNGNEVETIKGEFKILVENGILKNKNV